MYPLKTFINQALNESLPPYEVNYPKQRPGTESVNPTKKEECSKLTKLLTHDLHIGQLDGQGEEQASCAVEENKENDDPHIMLNASKVVNMCNCYFPSTHPCY